MESEEREAHRRQCRHYRRETGECSRRVRAEARYRGFLDVNTECTERSNCHRMMKYDRLKQKSE